jgi:hypothetical protein
MPANNLSTLRSATEDGLAADAAAFCAKQNQVRSKEWRRQAGVGRINQGRFVSKMEFLQPVALKICRSS